MKEEKRNEELEKEISDIEEKSEHVEEAVIPPVEEPVPIEEPVHVEAAPEPKPEIPKSLKDEPKRIGSSFPSKFDKLKQFYTECKRVLRVTKKPDKEEFVLIVKVTAIGMGVIGIVGFLVHFAKELLF